MSIEKAPDPILSVYSVVRAWTSKHRFHISTRRARFAALSAIVALIATAFYSASSASSLRALFGGSPPAIESASKPAKAKAAPTGLKKAAGAQEVSGQASDPILGLADLNVARKGHAAAQLGNGKILIVGGWNNTGPVKESEIYDPVAKVFTLAANSIIPRTEHTVTKLADGRLLISGGRNNAALLKSTEIYDPAANSFSVGPQMQRSRSGHSATVLSDGKVLIAGGDTNGTAEIFDPSTQHFSLVVAHLSAPRAFHSAALLKTGKVLIAGGAAQDGSGINSAEIFDPQTMSFSATQNTMRGARVSPLLQVLPDGKVQVIGGDTDGSMEMFNAAGGYFTAYGHPASGSSTNSQVLRAKTRAALFHKRSQGPQSQGVHAQADGSTDQMLDRSSFSLTDTSNQTLVAGGESSAGQTLSSTVTASSSSATVTTDKTDYQPGETVTISGSNWQPGETVQLTLHRDNDSQDTVLSAAVDADGNFTNSEYVCQNTDLNATFILTAVGQTSGFAAQTTFTDANAQDGSGTMTVNPTSASAGSTGNSFTFSFRGPNNKDFTSGSQATLVVPAGWTAPQTGSSSSAGFVSTTNSGLHGSVSSVSISGSGPWTIAINFTTINADNSGNDGFNLTYAGGGTKVTAPSTGGTYTFTTQTKQNGGTLTLIASSPVVNVNQAPAITSPNSTTFVAGTAGSFTVTATGTPAPTFSESGALPSGVTLNGATGVLSGTPAPGTDGTYPITFTASNGILPNATQNFTLTVTLQTCSNFSAILEGQSSGSSIWQAGNLTGWHEQELIPARVRFCGGPVTNQTILIDFNHTKTQGGVATKGIEDLLNFSVAGPGSNVTITTAPHLISSPVAPPSSGDTWTYSLTINLTSSTGYITFNPKMFAGAHNFSGSSLNLSGSPSLGSLQITKPLAKVDNGTPILTLTKSGNPSTVAQGGTVTYTLNYQNTAAPGPAGFNSATGVQIVDTLPPNVTVTSPVSPACGPPSATCPTLSGGNTLIWNLGTLAPGAIGSVSFDVQVAPAAPTVTITNNASLSCAEIADVLASVDTTVTNSCTTPSVTTNPIDQTVCSGSTVTFTAAATGTPTPTVQWQVSTNGGASYSDLAGETSTTLSFTTIASQNGNKYHAVFTNTCSSVPTSAATLTVDATSVGGTVAAAQTICSGSTPASLTLSGQTGTVVKWQKSSDAAFTTPTDISSTSTTLTGATIGALTADTWFRAVVQSGVCSAANSASVKITVDPTSVGGSVAAAQTICSGSTPTSLTLSAQTGTVVKWQKSSDAAFTTPTDISSTSATLTGATIGALTSDTWFRAVVQSGVCSSANSASVKITVDPTSVGGSAAAAQTICSGSTPASLTLSGQTGTVVKWQKSSDAAFTTPTDISSTSTTLTGATIGALIADTWFRAVVQSGVCATANSASVKITVDPTSVGGSVSGSTTVCTGSNSGTLTLSGQTGNVVKWQYSNDNFSSDVHDIVNVTTSQGFNNLTGTTYYRAVVQSGVCAAANSSVATVTVNPASVGGSVSGSTTVCTGTNSGTLTLSGQTGTVVKWQFSTDNFTTDVHDIANTTTSQNFSNLTATTYYRAVVQSGVCAAANSSAATVTVNPASVGGSISGSTTVCTGTNSGTLTLSGQTGIVVKWQFSNNNFGSDIHDIGNTTASQNFNNLTATTYYRAVVQSGVCAATSSSVATVTVDSLPTTADAGPEQSLCDSTSATLAANTATVGTGTWSVFSGTGTFTDSHDPATTVSGLSYGANVLRWTISNGTCADSTKDVTITRRPSPCGKVGWWQGNGNATDIFGGYDGTLQGDATYGAGKVGQAFSVDGTGDFVEVSDNPNLDISGQITIDAWIKPAALDGRILDKSSGTNGYVLDVDSSGHLRLFIGSTSVSSTAILSTTDWTHVAGVYDGASLNLYINGVPDGSLAATGAIPTNTLPLRIGADQTGTDGFNGLIDEVHLFNQALSAAEVLAIFDAGSAGVCTSFTPPPSITVQPDGDTKCAGQPITFSVTATGTGTLTHQWRKDGTEISGEISSSYTISSVVVGDAGNYDVVVSDGCSSRTSTSATLTVDATSVGGTVAAAQTICNGSTPADLTLSGQTGTVVKWQKSSDAAFTSPTDISSTSTTLTAATIGALTADTWFRAVVQNGQCSAANSASVKITVDPTSVGGSAAAAQTICSGSTPASLTLSGQTGTVVKWQKSSDAAFTTPTDISSTSTTLTGATIGALTSDTWFRAVVQSGVCATANSASVKITVDPTSVGGSAAAAQTICSGSTPASLTLSGQTGTVVKWQKSSDSAFTSPTDISSTSTTLTGATIGALTSDTWFRAVVQSGVCATANSASVKITVDPTSVGGSVAAAQTICSGSTPASLTLSGQTGTVVKWQKSSDSAFTSPTDISITSTTLTGATIGALTSDTWFRAVVQSGVCASANSASVKITVDPTSVGGSVAAAQTICSGSTPASLTLSGQTGTVVKWQKSSDSAFTSPTDISSTSTTLTGATIGALTSDTWFRAVVQSGVCASANSASVKITVDPTSVGGSAAAAQTICSGSTPASLTLSGQTGTVVKWQKSSDSAFTSPTDISSTSTTLTGATIGALTSDTWFRAVVQSGVCATANSASVKITVNPTSVGGTATATASPICNGSSTTITLSGYTGTIQWQSSASSGGPFTDISGQTAANLNTGSLSSTTCFRAVVTSGVCPPANSSVATVTVNPTSVGGTATATTSPICSGSSTTITLSGYTGAIQWQSSANSGGPFTNIASQTSATLNTGALTSTTYYQAVVTSGVCPSATSSVATVTVNPTSVGGTATATTSPICSGSSTTINLSGYTGAIQWQSSASIGGPFTNIASQTSATLNTGALTSTTYYQAVVTSGVCPSATSNVATVLVNPTSVGGTATATASPICNGSSTTITLSGYTGTIQWQSSASSGGPFTDISGQTAATLNTGSLSSTTCFRAVVTSGVCPPANSSVATVTVNPTSVGGTATATTSPICSGSSTTITLSGYTGAIQWQSSASIGGPFTNIASQTSATLNTGALTSTTYYQAVVTSGVCPSATSNVATVLVNPTSVGGTATATASPICNGSSTTITLSGYTGTIQWQSSASSGGPFTDISGQTAANLNTGSLSSTTCFRAVVTSGVCPPANSSVATVTVNPTSVGGTATATTSPICSGSSTTITLSGYTGAIQWQSSANSGGPFTNIASQTSATLNTGALTSTTYYQAVVTSGVCPSATSSVATVAVDAPPTTATAGSNQEVCGLAATLNGNTPSTGTGTWTKVSGPASGYVTFGNTNANSPGATATVTAYGTYVFRWTIHNGVCADSSATVQITYDASPTTANAGPNQITGCAVMVANLAGNNPTVGTGAWSKVSGPGTVTFGNSSVNNTTATVNMYGVYVLRWTISNGVCTPSYSDVSITVYAPPAITSVSSVSQTVQYSDPITPVTISASDADSAVTSLNAATQWKKDAGGFSIGLPSGLSLSAPTTGVNSRTWTLSGNAMVQAGIYTVRVTVTDNTGCPTVQDITITVTPEDTTFEYSGDMLKTTGSSATNSTTSLQMAAVVREASDGNLGDKLNTTQIKFTLYKFTDNTFTSPVATCTGNVTSSVPGIGSATCTVSGIGADNYVVKLELLPNPGIYYQAPVEEAAVTVVLGGTGFTTGGGWLNDPNLGTRSNFGFTVKYLKNGNIQGNSLYIYRKTVATNSVPNPAGGYLPAGTYNWIIKSNSMGGLTQLCTTTTPITCTATFTGKNNITAVNRATGVAYSLGGNYNFQVDVADNSEPGSSPGAGPDTYAIRVWDTTTGTYYQLGTPPNTQLQINGGNIQVKP